MNKLCIEFRPTVRHALSMLWAALNRQPVRFVVPVALVQNVSDNTVRISAASLEA